MSASRPDLPEAWRAALAGRRSNRAFWESFEALQAKVGRRPIAALALAFGLARQTPTRLPLLVRMARFARPGRDSPSWRTLARLGLADGRRSVVLDALVGIRVHRPQRADLSTLARLAENSEVAVRELAVLAAGELRARGAVGVVERGLSDKSVVVREAAAFAIGCARWERAVRERLLLLASWDSSEKVRRTALLALCETADPAMAARVAKRARATQTIALRTYREAEQVLRERREELLARTPGSGPSAGRET